MRWRSSRRSANVQDRRGSRGLVGGGIGGVVVILLALVFGVNPADLIQEDSRSVRSSGEVVDEMGQFVAHVLGDTEDVWHELFARAGENYPEPELVLFTGAVQSACGFAQAAVGPFYCPRDRTIYIDLSFYDDLRSRFQAPGDFAQAYVIAHEVGHHVQNVLGLMEGAAMSRSTGPQSEAVRLELQADCFAGLWAHHAQRARNILEEGDVEEALGAASAIGDDNLQRRSQGYVVPESFTHGTSAQRAHWFRRGLETGSVQECDTRRAVL